MKRLLHEKSCIHNSYGTEKKSSLVDHDLLRLSSPADDEYYLSYPT